MNPKYKDQHRSKSNRLQNWDYSWVGYYFITIATKNREHYFGEIQNQKMNLSTIGKVAKTEWLNTPNIRPDMNIVIDEFCIMPNHFHAIINIGQNQYNQRQHRGYAMHRVSTVLSLVVLILPNIDYRVKMIWHYTEFINYNIHVWSDIGCV